VRGRIDRIAAGLEGNTPAERLVLMVATGDAPVATAAELFRVTRLEEEALHSAPPRLAR
jgi:hypothetical protein